MSSHSSLASSTRQGRRRAPLHRAADIDKTRIRSPRATRRATTAPDIDASYSFQEEESAYNHIGANQSIENRILDQNSDDGDSVPILESWRHVAFFIPRLIVNSTSILLSNKIVAFAILALVGSLFVTLTARILSGNNSSGINLRGRSLLTSSPQGAPQTTEEVVRRLLNLESKLAKISATSKEFEKNFLKHVRDEDQRVESFENDIKQKFFEQSELFKKIDGKSAKSTAKIENSLSELYSAFRDFQAQYEMTSDSITEISQRIKMNDQNYQDRFSEYDKQVEKASILFSEARTAITKFETRFIKQDGEISNLAQELFQLEEKVNQALDKIVSASQASALNAINELLPERLPVRFDDDGELYIEPAFWMYLQSAFASKNEHEEMQKEVKNTKKSVLENWKIWKSTSTTTSNEHKISWEEFLAKNEDSLIEYVEGQFKGFYDGLEEKKMFISRDSFMEILSTEMENTRNEFAKRLRKSEISLEKRLLEDHRNQKSTQPSWITRLTSPINNNNGNNFSQAAVETMVEEAILRFQEKMTRKVDYADIELGARVDPIMTSSTAKIGGSLAQSLLARFVGRNNRQSRAVAAENALSVELRSGNCWPFAGQDGRLVVRLSEWVFVDEVGISHVPSDLAVRRGVAPKEFEVWVEVESAEDREGMREAMRGVYPTSGNRVNILSDYDQSDYDDDLDEEFDKLMKTTGQRYVMVGRFLYDINAPFHLQQYNFPRAASRWLKKCPVRNIMFRFRQNWGGEVTCVYKALVYGRPAADRQLESDENDDEDEIGLGEDTPVSV